MHYHIPLRFVHPLPLLCSFKFLFNKQYFQQFSLNIFVKLISFRGTKLSTSQPLFCENFTLSSFIIKFLHPTHLMSIHLIHNFINNTNNSSKCSKQSLIFMGLPLQKWPNTHTFYSSS